MKAFILLVLALGLVVLLAWVTPWMVNRDSTLTLLALPFVWLAYLLLAGRVLRGLFRRPLPAPSLARLGEERRD